MHRYAILFTLICAACATNNITPNHTVQAATPNINTTAVSDEAEPSEVDTRPVTDPEDEQQEQKRLEMLAVADEIDTQVSTLSTKDQRIINRIREAIKDGNPEQLGTLYTSKITANIADHDQKQFWDEALYMAMNFASDRSCYTRAIWFLFYASRFLRVDEVCLSRATKDFGQRKGELVDILYERARRECLVDDYDRQDLNRRAQWYNAARARDPETYICH